MACGVRPRSSVANEMCRRVLNAKKRAGSDSQGGGGKRPRK